MIADRILLYAVTAGLLGALAFAGGQCSQKQAARTGEAKARADLAELQGQVAVAAAEAERDKADREAHVRDLLDASNKAREEGIAHAVEEQQRLVADLRAGNVRLREQWAGCRSQVSGDAGAGQEPDAGADDRAASAGRVVRAADDADIQIRGLQQYAEACRALTWQ